MIYRNHHRERETEEGKVRRDIMREAFVNGFGVKQIAGYFKLSICRIYEQINITELKRKQRENC